MSDINDGKRNTYLYNLERQAPLPNAIYCEYDIVSRPSYYGREYHGSISCEQAERLLKNTPSGSYLIRDSQNTPNTFVLVIWFEGTAANYKLHFDELNRKHYVGLGRFDTVHNLVADGLIHFYVNSHGANIIAESVTSNNYSKTPFYKLRYHTLRSNASSSPDSTDADSAPLISSGQGRIAVDSPGRRPLLSAIKQHNFKVHTFLAPTWCDFCAEYIWGFVAQGVKCSDCGFQSHKRCTTVIPHDCLPDLKRLKRVFGVPLINLVLAKQEPIPALLSRCIDELVRRDALSTEGLYRLTGDLDEVEMLRAAFDKDSETVDISEASFPDHATITSLIKKYLKELPDPVITLNVGPEIEQIADNDQLDDSERRMALRAALAKLPQIHYNCLRFILSHLNDVAAKSSVNLMTYDNLGTIFSATLMNQDFSDLTKIAAMSKKLPVLFSQIISEYQQLVPSLLPNESNNQQY